MRAVSLCVVIVAVIGCAACGDDASPDPDAAVFDAASADAQVTDAQVADGASVDAGAQTVCGPMFCDTASEICVQDIGIVASYRCIAVPMGCDTDRSCACAGVPSCGASVTCQDLPADNSISCCPKC